MMTCIILTCSFGFYFVGIGSLESMNLSFASLCQPRCWRSSETTFESLGVVMSITLPSIPVIHFPGFGGL